MRASPSSTLTEQAARRLLGLSDGARVAVSFLRPENHTWMIETGQTTYYVKAHTKSWYPDLESAAGAVRREHTAHRLLAAAGLPTPVVVATEYAADNPLGWPCLITEALAGRPLTEIVSDPVATPGDGDHDAAMRATGWHLRRAHALIFEHPGYLNDPAAPALTSPDGWQHPVWRFERFLQTTVGVWAEDARRQSPATSDAVMSLLADTMPRLRESFRPPRFTHGDCHANAVFLDRQPDGAHSSWSVTGLLDLEVASAANPAFDLNKIIIELVGRLRGNGYDWWTPLFDGYGTEPDFDLTRLLLVGAGPQNYTCLEHGWGLDRSGIIDHVLRAENWATLLNPA